jgi:hypothetical protein
MKVTPVFEAELISRGLEFSIDEESGRHVVSVKGFTVMVSLENLERDFSRGGGEARVANFVDQIVTVAAGASAPRTVEGLFWSLEPNDYAEPWPYRSEISNRVDKALAYFSASAGTVTFVTPEILEELGLEEDEAFAKAEENLARWAGEAEVQYRDIDGVRLGYLATTFPCKASLILAPNFKSIVEPTLGWPLLAVAPDRGFLYLWAARHEEFAGRVGHVVVREYQEASYPISTEVYQISDIGIVALGEFPVE